MALPGRMSLAADKAVNQGYCKLVRMCRGNVEKCINGLIDVKQCLSSSLSFQALQEDVGVLWNVVLAVGANVGSQYCLVVGCMHGALSGVPTSASGARRVFRTWPWGRSRVCSQTAYWKGRMV